MSDKDKKRYVWALKGFYFTVSQEMVLCSADELVSLSHRSVLFNSD